MRVVKKRLEVHALQWTGRNVKEMAEFLLIDEDDLLYDLPIVIDTLEGDMTARVGCYIIQGVRGEYWPVQEDIFLETYDILDE